MNKSLKNLASRPSRKRNADEVMGAGDDGDRDDEGAAMNDVEYDLDAPHNAWAQSDNPSLPPLLKRRKGTCRFVPICVFDSNCLTIQYAYIIICTLLDN